MFYLGIDVSKAKLDCCLLLDEQGLRKRNKVVANSAAGIAALLAWIAVRLPDVPAAQVHAIMESSGIYHQRPATLLHQADCRVSIANPSHVRHLAKGMGVNSKNDTIDSHVLARFGQMLKPQAWQPQSLAASTLGAMLDRRQALADQLLREQARCNKMAEAGLDIEVVQQSLQRSIEFLQEQITAIDDLMEAHIAACPDLRADRQLLQSIPAVGVRLGTLMLQLFASKRFSSAQQAAAYVGVIPVQRQSGTSLKGQSRLSKKGPAKLRATLYMGALTALRRNPHIKAHYDKLVASGRCKSVALGAAMRKLVHLCFGVLRSRQPYRADYVNPAHARPSAQAHTINQPNTGAAPVLIGA
jgi:transposase